MYSPAPLCRYTWVLNLLSAAIYIYKYLYILVHCSINKCEVEGYFSLVLALDNDNGATYYYKKYWMPSNNFRNYYIPCFVYRKREKFCLVTNIPTELKSFSKKTSSRVGGTYWTTQIFDAWDFVFLRGFIFLNKFLFFFVPISCLKIAISFYYYLF